MDVWFAMKKIGFAFCVKLHITLKGSLQINVAIFDYFLIIVQCFYLYCLFNVTLYVTKFKEICILLNELKLTISLLCNFIWFSALFHFFWIQIGNLFYLWTMNYSFLHTIFGSNKRIQYYTSICQNYIYFWLITKFRNTYLLTIILKTLNNFL